MILVIERALGAPKLFVMSIDPPPTITVGGPSWPNVELSSSITSFADTAMDDRNRIRLDPLTMIMSIGFTTPRVQRSLSSGLGQYAEIFCKSRSAAAVSGFRDETDSFHY
jgi:hypothetical protein